jgi:ribosomal protein S18 acetylase RimI-like enzyme
MDAIEVVSFKMSEPVNPELYFKLMTIIDKDGTANDKAMLRLSLSFWKPNSRRKAAIVATHPGAHTMAPERWAVLATNDNSRTILGWICWVLIEDGSGHIQSLYVDNAVRRREYGKALLDVAKNSIHSGAYLTTLVDQSNLPAFCFYLKNSFYFLSKQTTKDAPITEIVKAAVAWNILLKQNQLPKFPENTLFYGQMRMMWRLIE